MGLEVRHGKNYYYRKVRRGGRVVSVYLGAGDAALLLAAKDESEKKKWAEESARLMPPDITWIETYSSGIDRIVS